MIFQYILCGSNGNDTMKGKLKVKLVQSWSYYSYLLINVYISEIYDFWIWLHIIDPLEPAMNYRFLAGWQLYEADGTFVV